MSNKFPTVCNKYTMTFNKVMAFTTVYQIFWHILCYVELKACTSLSSSRYTEKPEAKWVCLCVCRLTSRILLRPWLNQDLQAVRISVFDNKPHIHDGMQWAMINSVMISIDLLRHNSSSWRYAYSLARLISLPLHSSSASVLESCKLLTLRPVAFDSPVPHDCISGRESSIRGSASIFWL